MNHLDRHRLVTADVHVIKPEYIKISIKCKVRLTKKSNQDIVSKRIITKLADFLNPITGGSEGKGWPFGRPVYPSEIYQEIKNDVEGIDFISNVLIASSSGNLCKLYQEEAIEIPHSGLYFPGSMMLNLYNKRQICYKRSSIPRFSGQMINGIAVLPFAWKSWNAGYNIIFYANFFTMDQ